MDLLIELLIVSFAVAYFTEAIQAFYDLKKLRGFVALPFAVLFCWLFGYPWIETALFAPASSFLALAITMFITKEEVSVQPIRRY
jgi:hypothetical protein